MAKKGTTAVHRPLTLATPVESGADVERLQQAINKRFDELNIDRELRIDGEFGQRTFSAAKQVALSIGVRGGAQRKLKRGRVSKGTQRLIRKARTATVAEQARAKTRAGYRRRLRKRYDRSGGEVAVARGKRLVGISERPPGSNLGAGNITLWQRFTGYAPPPGVYWCGCLAAWVVCKLGGAKGITSRIRLGFAPFITADAQAGVNGLRAVPVAEARAGDLGCLWGGQHIVVVTGPPVDGYVPTLEGNTTAPGQSGSQSNGGCVAENRRAVSDFDQGIVARPTYP